MQAGSSAARAAPPSNTTPSTHADLALPTFARGVIALLQIWPALRLAVTHNWKPAHTTNDPEYPPEDAAQKRTRMAEELVDAYYSAYPTSSSATSSLGSIPAPDKEDIQDFLLEFFEYEYGVLLEDSSEVQLAQDLEDLWKECITKARNPHAASTSESLLDKFEKMADKAKTEDADPAKAFRGTRTGPQDDEEDEEYTSGDDEEEGEEGESRGAGDADMEVDDGQDTAQRTAAAHPQQRQREEPQVDEDGFTTVTKKKGGRS